MLRLETMKGCHDRFASTHRAQVRRDSVDGVLRFSDENLVGLKMKHSGIRKWQSIKKLIYEHVLKASRNIQKEYEGNFVRALLCGCVCVCIIITEDSMKMLTAGVNHNNNIINIYEHIYVSSNLYIFYIYICLFGEIVVRAEWKNEASPTRMKKY